MKKAFLSLALLTLATAAVASEMATLTVGDLLKQFESLPPETPLELRTGTDADGNPAIMIVPVVSDTEPEPPAPQLTPAMRDIREWETEALPICAIWHTEGHTPDWQADQIEAGHRLIPTFRLPQYDLNPQNCLNPKTIAKFETWTRLHSLVKAHKLGVCLRTNNIGDCFKGDRWRMPAPTDGVAPINSPLGWKIVDGEMNDVLVTDQFGLAANYETEGRLWGSSQFVAVVRERLGIPTWWMLRENGEGMSDGDNPKRYSDTTRGTNPDGSTKRVWKSYELMTTLSLRMRDNVYNADKTLKVDADPYKLWPESASLHIDHFRRVFDSFQAQLIGWPQGYYSGYGGGVDANQPQSIVDQYGPCPRTMHWDAGSARTYWTMQNGDFTSPLVWDLMHDDLPADVYREQTRGHTYRDRSVYLAPKAIMVGFKSGKHGPITPSKWGEWCTLYAWILQRDGIPVCLTYWENYDTTPDLKMLPEADYQAAADSGHPELQAVTIEQYEIAMMAGIDRICENATLRQYWIESTPVRMPRPDGPVTHWWEGRERGGKTLLYVWSPLEMPGPTEVQLPGGAVTIPVPGYWIVDGSSVTPIN